MKTVSLRGSLRENVGKKDARILRAKGHVPCVVYGGKEQIHFSMDATEFKDIIFTPEVNFANIQIGSKQLYCMLQEIQYHPVTDEILHADFMELMEEKEIKIGIPVKFSGTSKGILRGGKLYQNMRKLYVKALPKDLPEAIVIDITNLNIGGSIKVKDLTKENIQFLDAKNLVVVSVKSTRAVGSEEPEEAEEAVEEKSE